MAPSTPEGVAVAPPTPLPGAKSQGVLGRHREGSGPGAGAGSEVGGRSRWWKIRLFRGMVDDLRRRAPYYGSDWTDAWDYRVVPATVYMYFAK